MKPKRKFGESKIHQDFLAKVKDNNFIMENQLTETKGNTLGNKSFLPAHGLPASPAAVSKYLTAANNQNPKTKNT
jgi:hypothetical protein